MRARRAGPLSLLAAICAGLVLPRLALADGKAPDAAPKPVGQKEVAPKEGSKAKKILELGAISVEGHLQKPQAFYILPRSSLNYSALDQQESFLPKIKKALQQDPF